MLHNDVLRQLMPLELGPLHERDLAVEGACLDEAAGRIRQVAAEFFADSCAETLPDWERVYGLNPAAGDPVAFRRDLLLRKLRERGGLSKAYFIQLAEHMGYAITINEFTPFMAGFSRIGDRLYRPDAVFSWQVNVSKKPTYNFRAGQSYAGDQLGYMPDNSSLEGLFEDLKPAHTTVVFNYA